MTPEPTFVRGVGIALYWFSVRPGHGGSLSSLPADDGIEQYRCTFAHASLDLLQAVPSDRYLVNEGILEGIRKDILPLMKPYPFLTQNNLMVPTSR